MVRGGGLDELFDGTSKRGAKREKFGAEEDNARKRSKTIHRYESYCMTSSITMYNYNSIFY